jgi:microcystin-dependent protein
MPNLTPHYSLYLPLVNDPTDQDLWGGYLNANFTTLDTTVYNISTTLTALAATVAALAGTPTGAMMTYMGSSVPTAWLECNGALVSRATYAALFAAIGTTYGAGDGSTTFQLPSMARRTAVGRGGVGTATLANTLGSVGGEETHTLTTAELAAHSHSPLNIPIGTTASPSGTTLVYSNYSGPTNPYAGSTGSAGGDTAHNNMQPSIVTMFIIKT